MDINKIIEEEEQKMFDKLWNKHCKPYSYCVINPSSFQKDVVKAIQHKLLQSIVEEIEGMKDYDIEDTDFDEGSPSYNETHNRGYHKALTDLKAKLTINIKE
jgi:hypothetical protein